MSLETVVREIVREELAVMLPEKVPGEKFLSTKEVAALTGLSVSYFEVKRSHDAPDQPPYSRIGRRIVYRRSDILAWLEGRKR